MKVAFTILAIVISLLSSTAFSQNKKTNKEKRQEKREKRYMKIESLIDSTNYTFNALKANTAGGRQIDLTTHIAYLKINNDSVEAYLPFFGRAYSVDYGGGDSGFEFKTKLTSYNVKKNTDKLSIIILFEVKDQNDNYKCYLTTTSKESATLFISSNKKASISFYGNISINKN